MNSSVFLDDISITFLYVSSSDKKYMELKISDKLVSEISPKYRLAQNSNCPKLSYLRIMLKTLSLRRIVLVTYKKSVHSDTLTIYHKLLIFYPVL